jgi:hypothetical protein
MEALVGEWQRWLEDDKVVVEGRWWEGDGDGRQQRRPSDEPTLWSSLVFFLKI